MNKFFKQYHYLYMQQSLPPKYTDHIHLEFQQLKYIAFDPSSQRQLPNITSLLTTPSTTSEFFQFIQYHCPKLKEINIQSPRIPSKDPQSPTVRVNQVVTPLLQRKPLQHLQVKCYNFQYFMKMISQNHQHKLKTLIIQISTQYAQNETVFSVLPRFVPFLQKLAIISRPLNVQSTSISFSHSNLLKIMKNLRSLTLDALKLQTKSIKEFCDAKVLYQLEHLSLKNMLFFHKIQEQSVTKMAKKLKNLKNFQYNSQFDISSKMIAFLGNISKLQTLKINDFQLYSYALNKTPESIIVEFQPELEELVFYARENKDNIGFLIENLPKLKKFNLPESHENILRIIRFQPQIVTLKVIEEASYSLNGQSIQLIVRNLTELEQLHIQSILFSNNELIYASKLKRLRILKVTAPKFNLDFSLKLVFNIKTLTEFRLIVERRDYEWWHHMYVPSELRTKRQCLFKYPVFVVDE